MVFEVPRRQQLLHRRTTPLGQLALLTAAPVPSPPLLLPVPKLGKPVRSPVEPRLPRKATRKTGALPGPEANFDMNSLYELSKKLRADYAGGTTVADVAADASGQATNPWMDDIGRGGPKDKYYAGLMASLDLMERAGTPGSGKAGPSFMGSLAGAAKTGIGALAAQTKARKAEDVAKAAERRADEELRLKGLSTGSARISSMASLASALNKTNKPTEMQALVADIVKMNDYEVGGTEHKKLLNDIMKAKVEGTGGNIIDIIREFTGKSDVKLKARSSELHIPRWFKMTDDGKDALKALSTVDRMRKNIITGNLKTGGGQSLISSINSVATRFEFDFQGWAKNLGIDTGNLDQDETFQAQKAQLMFNMLGQNLGKGISDHDVKLIESMVANMGLTPEANLQIAHMIEEGLMSKAEEGYEASLESEKTLGRGTATFESKGYLKRLTGARKSRDLSKYWRDRKKALKIPSKKEDIRLWMADPKNYSLYEEYMTGRRRAYGE